MLDSVWFKMVCWPCLKDLNFAPFFKRIWIWCFTFWLSKMIMITRLSLQFDKETEKNLNRSAYNTRSKGDPPTTPQWRFFTGTFEVLVIWILVLPWKISSLIIGLCWCLWPNQLFLYQIFLDGIWNSIQVTSYCLNNRAPLVPRVSSFCFSQQVT